MVAKSSLLMAMVLGLWTACEQQAGPTPSPAQSAQIQALQGGAQYLDPSPPSARIVKLASGEPVPQFKDPQLQATVDDYVKTFSEVTEQTTRLSQKRRAIENHLSDPAERAQFEQFERTLMKRYDEENPR
jgi:hypothetical protein